MDPSPNALCSIAGWGVISRVHNQTPQQSPILQKAQVDIVSCQQPGASPRFMRSISQLNTKSIFCANKINSNGRVSGACSGDSGGGLQCSVNGKAVVFGLVSFGSQSCEKANEPGVYTNIGSYIDWIHETIKSERTTTTTTTPCATYSDWISKDNSKLAGHSGAGYTAVTFSDLISAQKECIRIGSNCGGITSFANNYFLRRGSSFMPISQNTISYLKPANPCGWTMSGSFGSLFK